MTSFRDIKEVAFAVCEACDTPRALGVAIRLKHDLWGDLVNLRVHPSDYLDESSYDRDSIAVNFLRKMPCPSGVDTTEVATRLWWENEQKCKFTNRFLDGFLHREAYPLDEDLNDPHFQRQRTVVRLVRKWVRLFMGKCPTDYIGRPSKKATYRATGLQGLIINKFSSLPERTLRCDFSQGGFSKSLWYRSHIGNSMLNRRTDSGGPILVTHPCADDIVRGNRFSTVPKDGTTDRSIGCEPTLNIWAQLGVGDVLKKRLRRNNLLCTMADGGFDSQAAHRSYARKGSIDGSLCTIDCKSASDLIARLCVELLVDKKWFELLSSLRSPMTQVSIPTQNGKRKKTWVMLEKFSSMGNGYTFELETAIFAACGAAALELSGQTVKIGENLSVYGDDIVISPSAQRMLRAILLFLGFELNLSKSFITGPFRESCGGDFFNGYDVRPIHITKNPTGPSDWITVHNQVKRLESRIPVSKALAVCRSFLPTAVKKCSGPAQFGDLVLHEPERNWGLRVVHSARQIQVVLPDVPELPRSRWDEVTEGIATIYGVSDKIPIPNVDVRGYRISWVAFP